MRKYRTRPKSFRRAEAWDEDQNQMDTSITVYESEPRWEPIGILGPDGEPLGHMIGTMEPIGFIHFEDEE